MEKTYLAVLFAFLVVSIFAVVIPVNDNVFSGGCPEGVSAEEKSRLAAEEYVTRSRQFREYGGRNLVLSYTEEMCCSSCWKFHYNFEVETDDLPRNVTGFQFTVPVKDGNVDNPNIFTIEIRAVEKLSAECASDIDCRHDIICNSFLSGSENGLESPDVQDDCETLFEYLVMSNCPYGTSCIDGVCTVVCPLMFDENGCGQGSRWCESAQQCESVYPFECDDAEKNAKEFCNEDNVKSVWLCNSVIKVQYYTAIGPITRYYDVFEMHEILCNGEIFNPEICESIC